MLEVSYSKLKLGACSFLHFYHFFQLLNLVLFVLQQTLFNQYLRFKLIDNWLFVFFGHCLNL